MIQWEETKWNEIMVFYASFVHIVLAKLGQADDGYNEVKLTTKHAPEWVRSSDPLIRDTAHHLWTTVPTQMMRRPVLLRNLWWNMAPSGFDPVTHWLEIQHITSGLLCQMIRRPVLLRNLWWRDTCHVGTHLPDGILKSSLLITKKSGERLNNGWSNYEIKCWPERSMKK